MKRILEIFKDPNQESRYLVKDHKNGEEYTLSEGECQLSRDYLGPQTFILRLCGVVTREERGNESHKKY